MAINDLTTISLVKQWQASQQNIQSTTSGDPLISREITRVSAAMLAWMGRDTIGARVYNDVYDGPGQPKIMLRRYPVVQIIDPLIVSNTLIAAGPANTVGAGSGFGYYLDQWDGVLPGNGQLVQLNGGAFWRGVANVSISYLAGYVTLDEAWTVPADPFQIVPNSINGTLTMNYRVKYATSGTALTAVAGSPSVGQYVAPKNFDATSPTNYYQFAAADEGAAILISYGYVPDMLEGAACELVAERLAYRTRIGQKSKLISGNESIVFDLTDFPEWIKSILQPYKMVTPL